MIVGVPREIKESENRVAIVPGGVDTLKRAGHKVLIEKGAGEGSGISDEDYRHAGAEIVPSARDVYERAELIFKVKEPLAAEYPLIKPQHTIFTYFHLAASLELTEAMLKSGATCIAYETIEVGGQLPLLTPMSEVAGRMSVQEGAHHLSKHRGGRGVLLGGVPGVEPGCVVILGAGVVGFNAALMAAGLGARVLLMDINLDRLRRHAEVLPRHVTTLFSSTFNIRDAIKEADLVVGAVLLSGQRAPILVARSDLKSMKKGAVIVDVAVDQGGCVETATPTTHREPTYEIDGIVHYCVANMPGAVARTSTLALTNVTLPYALKIASLGARNAVEVDPGIRLGANTVNGHITHEGVARSFQREYVLPLQAFGT
jgi:alanine dehydrogenase